MSVRVPGSPARLGLDELESMMRGEWGGKPPEIFAPKSGASDMYGPPLTVDKKNTKKKVGFVVKAVHTPPTLSKFHTESENDGFQKESPFLVFFSGSILQGCN